MMLTSFIYDGMHMHTGIRNNYCKVSPHHEYTCMINLCMGMNTIQQPFLSCLHAFYALAILGLVTFLMFLKYTYSSILVMLICTPGPTHAQWLVVKIQKCYHRLLPNSDGLTYSKQGTIPGRPIPLTTENNIMLCIVLLWL